MHRTTSTRTAFTAAAFVLALAASTIAQPFDVVIDQLRHRSKLGTSTIGYVVVDAQTGEELAAHNATELFIPASNQKIVTSVAALSVLGPEFTFETRVLYDEEANRLIVKGDGDPALGDSTLLEEMGLSVRSFIDAIVDSVTSAGVPEDAELVVDDRIFDRTFVHPTWPKGQLNRWYCAEVSGLTFHTNTLSIFADPRRPGRPPELTLEPEARWLEIDSRKARSVGKGRHTLWAARRHMTNDISLRGDARYASAPVEVTIHEPAMFFANTLAQSMADAGIGPSAIRLADPGEDFRDARPIQTIRTPMPTVLERVNTDSHNLYAESLLKRMGHEITGEPGSWRNGATVARMVVRELAGVVSGKDLIIADGSGMSRENRITPETIARLLVEASNNDRMYTPLLESFATPGRGTLRRRFQNSRADLQGDVYGKSGYLKGVSALSGYVINERTGRSAVFSVMLNDVPSSVARSWVKRFEEGVVRAADAYVSGMDPAARVLGDR